MSRRLQRLLSALERVPDLAAVPRECCSLLGGDHAAASRFILPTRRVAGSVKSTGVGRTCIHEIRKQQGEYLEVCPDGCETATRSRHDVTVHRLDVASFAREIAKSLGLEALPAEAVPDMPGVWKIGDFVPSAGYRFPVCLTLAGELEILRSVLDAQAARGEPFNLFSHTRSAFGQAAAYLLKRTDSLFVALDELIGDSDGQVSLLDGHTAAGVFAGSRAAHMPEPETADGTVFFPTPAGAKGEHVSIRFIDRHSLYIDVQGVTGKYHCAQMGMASRKNAKPTVQWLLLETFAKGHGRIDWRNSSASRRKQKRKENLAADLERFFRIDGDPFALEGDG